MNTLIVQAISIIAQGLEILIIIRVLLSWADNNSFNPLIIQLNNFTDILLEPFKNIIPAERFGLDLSPIIAILAINICEKLLIELVLFIL